MLKVSSSWTVVDRHGTIVSRFAAPSNLPVENRFWRRDAVLTPVRVRSGMINYITCWYYMVFLTSIAKEYTDVVRRPLTKQCKWQRRSSFVRRYPSDNVQNTKSLFISSPMPQRDFTSYSLVTAQARNLTSNFFV